MKSSSPEAVRYDPEALCPHAVSEQPQHGRGDLLAEVRRNQHEALLVARVQHHVIQFLDAKEFAQVRRRVRAFEPAVEILLIDFGDLRLLQAGAVRDVLERLPHDIAARVVKLVLDDHQPALLVEGQEIEAFTGVREAVEFLLDDQELFAQRIRHSHQPFLKMVPLAKVQISEAPFFKADETIFRKVDLEHPPSFVHHARRARLFQAGSAISRL